MSDSNSGRVSVHNQGRRRLVLGLGASFLGLAVALAEDIPGHAPAHRPAPAKKKAKAPAAHSAQVSHAAPAEHAPQAAHVVEAGLDPEVAMSRLMDGNVRYMSGFSTHPNQELSRRAEVAKGQKPFASILACADSRVAPEILFDQGLGDLFVARVAGNVVDDAILASLEYSVIHLGSTLIMVLGHERCGAVKATIDALDGHGSEEDVGTKIGALAALIAPAVGAVPKGASDRLDSSVSMNAAMTAAEIFARSPPLRSRVLAGKLKIVAARYDLDDGRVTPARS